jgi:cytidine deaminase
MARGQPAGKAVLSQMIQLAKAARGNAYAPYSRYKVGACLRGDSGRLFAGCNVENAAYPQGQCAEVSAIGALVTAGDRRILECVVIGGAGALITPCGGCRQRLREFAGPDVPVHLCGPRGLVRTVTFGELLPLSFGPDHLKS